MTMPYSSLQPENALGPILVVPDGIVTVRSAIQPENVESFIMETLLGIAKLVNAEQFANALAPIVATPVGKVMPFKTEQPEKAPAPISLTLLGLKKMALARALHPENSSLLKLFTLAGIVMLLSPVQFANAP